MKFKKIAGADLRTNLVHLMTQADEHESRRWPNIYRIGHYLRAVDRIMEEIEGGSTVEAAFIENLNPTREMHGIAKALALKLDVDRGRWIEKGETEND